jgi:type II secretory pathway pseudopilin PulG
MKLTPHKNSSPARCAEAFTMVEVALSLAIIAFAIVAVIGILPTGMQVQRTNREQTIINQDGQFILEVLKTGQTNVNLLAQNLEWIESYTNISPSLVVGLEGRIDRTNLLQGTFTTNALAQRIVGLLSTPRFVINPNASNSYYSNWVQAKFVANSGPLADRLTEDSVTGTRDFAFAYLVTVDISPVVLSSTASNAAPELGQVMQMNMYNLRVNLTWPVYPNGTVGPGRKSFHTVVAGKLNRDTNGLYQFRPNEFTGLP